MSNVNQNIYTSCLDWALDLNRNEYKEEVKGELDF